jgi:hypothetical protein
MPRDRHLDLGGAGDHVVVREDLAIGGQDHAGAGAERPEAVGAQGLRGGIDVDDRSLGHGRRGPADDR